MAKDIIGKKNGEDFYVGQDAPATPPILQRYPPPVSPPPVPPPPIPTPPQIPASGQDSASGAPLTFDQFSQQRGGSVDEAAIRENVRKANQTYTDAINTQTAGLLAQEDTAGKARLDKVAALNVNSGLGGSNFATSSTLEQT